MIWLLQAIVPMLTLLIGMLLGVMVGDGERNSKEIDKLKREISRMKRRMANESNS